MHQLIDKKKKIIIYVIFLFILSTTSGKYIENKSKNYLTIDKINIAGLSNNKNLQILNELKNIYHQNLFFLREEKINKIISNYNIIEKYTVQKIYPSRLNIIIKPTEFIAQISGDNQLLVGANGKLILNEGDGNISIPYIFGKFDSKEFLKFKKSINLSKFNFDELKTIYFFPSKRWDILTDNNILIKLPEKDLFKSLKLAYKIISSDQFKNQNIIDLRVNNHLVIR